MGTETRVGIVAGLVIVVVASVYFFYGSGGGEDELLVATATRVGDAPKIPAAADQKGGKPASPTMSGVTGLAQNKQGAGTGQPPRRPAERRPVRQTPPAAGGAGPLVLADPSKTPVMPVKTNPNGAIPLRSGPSSELVEATWDNLVKKEDKPAAPQGSDLNTVADRIRNAVTTPPNVRTQASPNSPGASTATPTQLALANPDSRRPIPRPATGDPATEALGPLSPAGSANAMRPTSASGWPKRHVIAEGDTLEVISRDFYDDRTRIKELLAANPKIKGPTQLRIGDEITIPEPTWAATSAIATTPQKSSEPSKLTSPSPATPTRSTERTYVVKGGDTLYGIAQRQCGSGGRWKEILSLNKKLLRGDAKRLAPGMTLTLPD